MKVTLPENISEITLEQFQKFDKLSLREDLTDHEFNKRKIEIFTKLKYHDLDNVSRKDFKSVMFIIDKALSVDVPFKNTFKLDGVEYGFIPNLDKMTTAEYIDLRTYDANIETLHKTMAILFRPITFKDGFDNYTIESYSGTEASAEAMKRMPLNIVNGALVFFYNLSNELADSIQRYTEQEVLKGAKPPASSRNGDGMPPYLN